MPEASAHIALSRHGRIVTLTMVNPRSRNALTRGMLTSIIERAECAASDPGIAVLVLTGSDGHFSAGLDIADIDELLPGTEGDPFSEASEAIARFPGATVAVIRGSCMGAGVGLALACDIRLSANDASFALTPSRLGVLYPAAPTRRLVDLVGVGWAKRLLLTGEVIQSPGALGIGLISESSSSDQLDERASALCELLASNSDFSIAGAKRMIDAAARDDDVAAVQSDWASQDGAQQDRATGRRAFIDRALPAFLWRRP